MDCEIEVKKHFFDDEEPIVAFAFQDIEDKYQKSLKMPAIVKDSFFTILDTSDPSKTSTYGLHNKLLVKYKNNLENEPESVLELSFARLYSLKAPEGKTVYGFSIVKNNSTYEFWTQDKQISENWFEALRKICILCSFHDDFKAIKMIGRGSFAKVYLVESKATGKSYAVKAFTKDSLAVTNKANAKPALLNEIELMRNLDHENIIKLYDVYETDKSIYLVLELIQGKSLYDFFKRPKDEITATRVINLLRSLLDALAYLASKGIMHRDLKPDNILLDKGEKVKIVDFGLATFIDVPSYIFKKCGTPGYIAPEVFKYDEKDPATHYDDRCDAFSAGCLFYYMLFHTLLFPGATAGEILKQNKKFDATYPQLASIRAELENPNGKISKDGLSLLLDLIEFDHHKRVTASQALNHPYFVPVPMGMHKVAGSNEFVIVNVPKFSQNEIYSPASPHKAAASPLKIITSLSNQSQDQVQSPLTPLRLDTFEKDTPSPLLPNKDRFVNQDSLYLDLGKPEINGRVDTIASGSITGSLLLPNRPDSSTNLPACQPSAFANKANSRSGMKAYKPLGQTVNQSSFLKAAILKNIQKNNSEGLKEEDALKGRFDEMRATRNYSENARNYSENASPVSKGEGIEMDPRNQSESPQIKRLHTDENENDENREVQGVQGQLNFDAVKMGDNERTSPQKRRFQPFAPANLIIPKPEENNAV